MAKRLRTEQRLPNRVLGHLIDIFAARAPGGMSGPALVDFFSAYSFKIRPYRRKGPPPRRSSILADCLARLTLLQKKEAIRDLLDHPAATGADADSLVDIRAWLGEMSSSVAMPAASVRQLRWQRVREEWQKANARLQSDPEGALTIARTVLESVCLHILESRGVTHKRDGDLSRMYKAATEALGLSRGAAAAGAVGRLLDSCRGAVGALAPLRNAFADAHGRGPADARLGARETVLAINLAFSVASYLVATAAAKGMPEAQSSGAGAVLAFPTTARSYAEEAHRR
jgi:hypothetical protein